MYRVPFKAFRVQKPLKSILAKDTAEKGGRKISGKFSVQENWKIQILKTKIRWFLCFKCADKRFDFIKRNVILKQFVCFLFFVCCCSHHLSSGIQR